MFRKKKEEERREDRAQRVYERREQMLKEIVPLSDVNLTTDDFCVCLGCGSPVLRGWKDLHVSQHAWKMATNPFGYLDSYSLHAPPRPRAGDPAR